VETALGVSGFSGVPVRLGQLRSDVFQPSGAVEGSTASVTGDVHVSGEVMSLVKLIAEADERGLAASGLGCLDRCLPLLAEEAEILRPLWAGIVDGEKDWAARLAETREAVNAVIGVLGVIAAEPAPDVTATLVGTMLASAPSEWAPGPLRAWAGTCSLVALEMHQGFEAGAGTGTPGGAEAGAFAAGSATASERLARCREDAVDVPDAADGATGSGGVGPLVAGELRRQIRILELLAELPGAPGLRQALDLSTEGQRVLRAVVSRRARAGS
jgi:hypothetical protein